MGIQIPDMKTPVAKCLKLAVFTSQMLGKFPANAALMALVPKMDSAAQLLGASQNKYAEAVFAIIPTRVDAKFYNIIADKRIRQTQQKAELAGKSIATHAFPKGSSPIIRLQGQSQIDEMIGLEGRLQSLEGNWNEAGSEKQAIAQHRDNYDKALKARDSAANQAKADRAARNLQKRAFITVYSEIVHRVKAEFADDPTMQELFFDEVRIRPKAGQDDDEDLEEDDGDVQDEGSEAKPA